MEENIDDEFELDKYRPIKVAIPVYDEINSDGSIVHETDSEEDREYENKDNSVNFSRREFLDEVIRHWFPMATLAAIGAGSLNIGYAAKIHADAESEATSLHPNERLLNGSLRTIAASLGSAKGYLDYTPGRTETYTECHSDGDGHSTCTPKTRYIPPNYPNPRPARKELLDVMNEYDNHVKTYLYDEHKEKGDNIRASAENIFNKLPDIDTQTVDSEVYANEMVTLDWARGEVENMRKVYEEVLYREVRPEMDLAAGGGVSSLALIGAVALVYFMTDPVNKENDL